jgi:proliferating cell nuclear antigen
MVFECAKDDDWCTIKVTNTTILASRSLVRLPCDFPDNPLIPRPITGGGRVAEYDTRPTDFDIDMLCTSDEDYGASITMTSAGFNRIVREFSSLGESVRIEASKEGVLFVHNSRATQVDSPEANRCCT